ncbi:MAG: small multi-drug export protein [Chloroflexi bacterium]|nr:small multi-drug export protein [Chloroflexota bacterium]
MDVKEVLWVFLISAAPIGELRAGIPIGIHEYHLPWAVVLPVSLLGNLVIVPFLVIFLERSLRLLSKIGWLAKVFQWIFQRTKRQGRIIERYHRVGLALFVAIPLPGTGAWTGSLAASLFGIGSKDAIIAIVCGVLMAAIIVSILTLLGWVGAAVAASCFIILSALAMRKP